MSIIISMEMSKMRMCRSARLFFSVVMHYRVSKTQINQSFYFVLFNVALTSKLWVDG